MNFSVSAMISHMPSNAFNPPKKSPYSFNSIFQSSFLSLPLCASTMANTLRVYSMNKFPLVFKQEKVQNHKDTMLINGKKEENPGNMTVEKFLHVSFERNQSEAN